MHNNKAPGPVDVEWLRKFNCVVEPPTGIIIRRSWSHLEFDMHIVRTYFATFHAEVLSKLPMRPNPFFDKSGNSTGITSLEEFLPPYCLLSKQYKKLSVLPSYYFDGTSVVNTFRKGRRHWSENELYLGKHLFILIMFISQMSVFLVTRDEVPQKLLIPLNGDYAFKTHHSSSLGLPAILSTSHSRSGSKSRRRTIKSDSSEEEESIEDNDEVMEERPDDEIQEDIGLDSEGVVANMVEEREEEIEQDNEPEEGLVCFKALIRIQLAQYRNERVEALEVSIQALVIVLSETLLTLLVVAHLSK